MPHKLFSLPATLALAVLFALACFPLQAQYENGTLVGTIRDSTGAPIAKATVKITNTATGIVTTTTANEAGDYEVPSLRTSASTPSRPAPRIRRCRRPKHHHLRRRPPAHRPHSEGRCHRDHRRGHRRRAAARNRHQRTRPNHHATIKPRLCLSSPATTPTTGYRPRLAPGAHCRHHQLHQLAGPRRRIQRQRPAQHVQQLPARRSRQQRLRRKQPGIRQPDHRHSARLRRPVPGRHQQRERRVRPLLRRHHQRRLAERNQPLPRASSTSSSATPTSMPPASSSP